VVLTKSAVQTIGAAIFLVLIFFAIRPLAIPSAEASPASLSKTYKNPAYGFALKMPADFSVYPPNASPGRDAAGALTGEVIILRNNVGAAVQIEVTQDNRAVSGTNVLTADDVEQLVPYLDLSNAQAIQIAPDITGVTFTSTTLADFEQRGIPESVFQ
jgi:hypothetical protein